MNRKGFTMIELILVIAILGILAISALPRFLDLSESAEEAARDGVVGAVRAGVAIYHANQLVNQLTPVWPATLDANADGACTTCYSTVLESPISDTKWTKAGLIYTYTTTGGTATAYTYVPATGAFQ